MSGSVNAQRVAKRASGGRWRCPAPRLVVAMVATMLLAVSVRPALADAGLDAYNTAVALHKDKRYDLAAEAFRKFLKDHATHEKAPFAELYLGLTLVNLEKYTDARDTLRSFVKKNPQNRNLPDAMYRVAECSYLLNDFAAAEADFAAFGTQFPKHELQEWALAYLGDAQLRQKKHDAAAASFLKSLELHPKGRMAGEAKFGLARSYEALKKEPEAVALYTEVAADATNPRAPQALVSLAARQYDAGKFEEAAAAYLKLPEKFPESPLVPSARLNAGFAYYRSNHPREAIAQLELAAKEESQKASALYWSGMSRMALREYPEAAGAFKTVYDLAPAGPFAEKSLYQWADSELQSGKLDAARQRFLEVAKSFPKGSSAAESLLHAAEASLRLGKLDDAQSVGQRLTQEYPASPFTSHVELLQARVLDARGDDVSRKAAATRFESLLKNNGDARVQTLARLHLTRLQQKGGQHEQALATIAPVLDVLKKDGAKSEFSDALVLAGTSFLATKQNDRAIETATAYLDTSPTGDPVDQALSLRATAEARRGKTEPALADVARLQKDFPKSPALPQTLLDVAEACYGRKEFDQSSKLFDQLAKSDAAKPLRAAGASGSAWSAMEAGRFRDAAAAFADVFQQYGDDPARGPEAGFMRGLALQKAGDGAAAAEALAAAFAKLTPAQPAPAGSELKGAPHYFAFHSGLEAARGWRKLMKRPEADKIYDELFRRYPQAKDRDLLLDEWALMHYEAEDFARADELFRILVRDFPKSTRADDARLNLAESEYAARKLEPARKEFAALADAAESNAIVQKRALFNLVRIAAELRDWKEVQAAAAKYIAKDGTVADPPKGDRAHVEALLGEAQLSLGDAKSARATLSRLYALKGDAPGKESWFPQVRILLAEAHVQLKEYDAAEKIVLDFRKDDPQSPVLHRADEVLGRSYKNQAKFAEARSQFERVVADKHAYRTETAAKCQFLLAETYMMQKDYKNAQIEYFKVEQLYKHPEWQSTALFQVAKCDEALNRWKDAVRAYEDLLKKYPDTRVTTEAKTELQAARRKALGG